MWPGETDAVELAVRARQALAAGRDATLEVLALGESGSLVADPHLHEHDGRPVLVCPDMGSAGDWVDRPVRLSLAGDVGELTPTRIVFSGRLGRPAGADLGGDAVTLELRVEQVAVTIAGPAGAVESELEVDLELYWLAGPDPIASQAAAILTHSNTHHEPELREFAARCGGAHPDHIASAALTWVGREGAGLVWVDLEGAHEHLIRFPTAAQTPAMLSSLLSDQLDPR